MAESKTSVPFPYWLVNVPKSQWPAECPDFLRDISERDKAMISIPASEFHRLTWPEVQEIVKTNKIDKFQRSPLDQRRYKEFVYGLDEQYGSVTDFVREERLEWNDIEQSGAAPFQDPSDIKILYNDWPYGIDKSIVHLVVWTKFVLEDDPEIEDLTAKMREDIDEYVNRTFGSRVPTDKIIWFKNWGSIKSIHGLEHFHVMLKYPNEDFLQEIANGDLAVSDQLP